MCIKPSKWQLWADSGGGRSSTIQQIRLAAGMQVSHPRTRWTHGAGVLTAPQLAAKLTIPVNWLYVQVRKGRLLADRLPTGAHIFNDTAVVLVGVQSHRDQKVERLDLRIGVLTSH